MAPEQFFCSDGAPDDVAQRRREGFERLAALYQARFAQTIRATEAVAGGISDLQFTEAYRVPYQYSRFVRETAQGRHVRAVVRRRHGHRP